ncbi:MAG TPA: hypothetical protein VHH90_09935 [Polyangia bacterium]|nr:hypothetical protein [Polyangia bacterium]
MARGLWSRFLCLTRAASLSALLAAPAGAAVKHATPRPKKPPKGCAVPKVDPPVAPVAVTGAKVAVLAFTGDDAEAVRRQVMHALRAKGIKMMTSLRPVDSPEQFREMSATLNLVAYVDGEVAVDGTAASATVFVRNGSTGMRTASATFAGDRRALGASIAKELWDRIGGAMSDAVAEAAKPHKAREPMRINAGAPLTNAEAAEPAE